MSVRRNPACRVASLRERIVMRWGGRRLRRRSLRREGSERIRPRLMGVRRAADASRRKRVMVALRATSRR
jgi:hypothetical protein